MQRSIELKYYGDNPYLAERVVECVRMHELTAPNDIVIMSLDLEAVRQVRRLAAEIRIGYLAAFTAGTLARLPVEFLAVDRHLATDRFLRAAQRTGLRCTSGPSTRPELCSR